MTLWVGDLAPYRKKLDAHGQPYLIRGWPESGVGGLIVAIPGATSVLELRSDSGLSAEELAAHPWNTCKSSADKAFEAEMQR